MSLWLSVGVTVVYSFYRISPSITLFDSCQFPPSTVSLLHVSISILSLLLLSCFGFVLYLLFGFIISISTKQTKLQLLTQPNGAGADRAVAAASLLADTQIQRPITSTFALSTKATFFFLGFQLKRT
ncbi:hypothetical protein L6164_013989 [Bauhinia variegata]|uniref:Uncharacterized protein n=1 Tax=Bauhinia variegata TaxID=167791 RepID=A0ACB9NG06_BAUVA|nr:hypothetical protein L6164_013989 [Bauhinia variegata]